MPFLAILNKDFAGKSTVKSIEITDGYLADEFTNIDTGFVSLYTLFILLFRNFAHSLA